MRNKQGLTIAALIIAIVGLSIGFAAFSNTLNISTNASVNPSDTNFIVQFSKYSDSDSTGELNPITPSSATYGVNGLIPDSNKKSLTGLKATFTQPGQSVTYNLYVRNTGSYVAYLKDVTFANAANATGGETYKHCYAATKDSNSEDLSSGEMATGSLVTAACNGISISVTIGTSGAITPESQSKSLGNQALAAVNGYVQASVTISYANNASYVDGPMVVEFGDISFTASSNQGSSGQQSSPSSPSSPSTPASQVDALIPTEIELGTTQYDSVKDGYPFTTGGEVIYHGDSVMKAVMINYNNASYFWACDSSAASYTGLDMNKWYDMSTGTPYTGPSPISLSSFNSEDIKSESYLKRIIDSFSNSNE